MAVSNFFSIFFLKHSQSLNLKNSKNFLLDKNILYSVVFRKSFFIFFDLFFFDLINFFYLNNDILINFFYSIRFSISFFNYSCLFSFYFVEYIAFYQYFITVKTFRLLELYIFGYAFEYTVGLFSVSFFKKKQKKEVIPFPFIVSFFLDVFSFFFFFFYSSLLFLIFYFNYLS